MCLLLCIVYHLYRYFQMLCPSPPTCNQLQKEEMWSHQQLETKEEAEVDCFVYVLFVNCYASQ